MKKVILFVVILSGVAAMSSCTSAKPSCAAYSEMPVEITE